MGGRLASDTMKEKYLRRTTALLNVAISLLRTYEPSHPQIALWSDQVARNMALLAGQPVSGEKKNETAGGPG
jgi:hypothetical protein